MSDAEGVANLVNEVELGQIGMAVYTVESLEAEWSEHGDALASNVRILEIDRRVAGFVDMHPDPEARELYFEGYVSPEWTGRGIGTRLIEIAEDEAGGLATRIGAPITLTTNVGSTAVADALEDRGYERGKHDIGMFLDLDGGRPEVVLPADIAIHPFVEGRDEQLMWDVMRAGFGDDWDGTEDAEEWLRAHTDRAVFDPALWFFARQGDRTIGAVQARPQWRAQADTGWLKNIAVLAASRHKGVGRALLMHAGALFHDRGKKHMVLGTYADNPTDAVSFYRHIGMRLGAESFDYSKQIGA
jgi:ribosomal protein S18 acetylase RimI-like enzyme